MSRSFLFAHHPGALRNIMYVNTSCVLFLCPCPFILEMASTHLASTVEKFPQTDVWSSTVPSDFRGRSRNHYVEHIMTHNNSISNRTKVLTLHIRVDVWHACHNITFFPIFPYFSINYFLLTWHKEIFSRLFRIAYLKKRNELQQLNILLWILINHKSRITTRSKTAVREFSHIYSLYNYRFSLEWLSE